MMSTEQLLTDMTLEEKVGQLFMLAFSGNRLDEARILMEEHLVGGAYISNENVPTPAAAVQLTGQLQNYAANTRLKIPLILGVDQEGAWSVMTPGSAPGPGNMAIGATGEPQLAYEMYQVIGKELAAVGLNTLLAPCADCNSNPMNSIIGMRSFGEKPQLVGAMTAAAVEGARAGGVLTTVKHFPGHGDTRLDTHRGLPTVERSGQDLRAIDLYPFAAGIKTGADIVMTAHIIFSALDPRNPATLSPIILQDILRGELGFEGVILSDSMNMHAMKKNYVPEQAVTQALRAGVDMIMLAEEHYDHDAHVYLDRQRALIRAVMRAAQDGTLTMERIDDAVRRILSLKARINLTQIEETRALAVVGNEAHRKIELKVARQAIAILRNRYGLIPIPETAPIMLVNTTARNSYVAVGHTRGIGPNQTTAAFDYFKEAIQQKRRVLRVISAEEILNREQPQFDDDAIILAVTENYPLAGMDFDQSGQSQTIRRLAELAPEKLIVVALRDPYELANFPQIETYMCAFSFRPCAAQAATEVLCGEISAAGHSPVSVPEAGMRL